MGTYLSSPVLDKSKQSGSALDCQYAPVAWGCVDMQGWRKSMEDAHVARAYLEPPQRLVRLQPTNDDDNGSGNDPPQPQETIAVADDPQPKSISPKVFAVFDGHGGPEVARFCEQHLVSVLVSQSKYREGDIPGALIDTFHQLDRMIDDPDRRDELIQLKTEPPKPHIAAATVSTPREPTNITPAANKPVQRRGQKEKLPLKQLQQNTTTNGTTTTTTTITTPTATEEITIEQNENDISENATNPSGEQPMDITDDNGGEKEKGVTNVAQDATKPNESHPNTISECINSNGKKSAIDNDPDGDSMKHVDLDEKPNTTENCINHRNSELEEPIQNDEPKETTDDTESNSDSADKDNGNEDDAITSTDTMDIFHKLLSMDAGTNPNPVESATECAAFDSNAPKNENSAGDSESSEHYAADDGMKYQPPPTKSSMTPTANPTRIQNGRQVCNLPDHPIHAGCTSVVAVMINRVLTIANAGDSRAVLCRAGGATEALSFDHKPLQEGEMSRITDAGGFVNQFGRVNGNLNLSRSIGDLKYKQTAGLPPPAQMITAEPDIVQVVLEDDDEFIILGCDGIWDCLTNEEAVRYVRERINSKELTEIGCEMLDDIISKDPRASQGIGGDNMTLLIVDLLPHKRNRALWGVDDEASSNLEEVHGEDQSS